MAHFGKSDVWPIQSPNYLFYLFIYMYIYFGGGGWGVCSNKHCECDDEDALHGRHVEMENLIV